MTRLVFDHDRLSMKGYRGPAIPVQMYGRTPPWSGTASIGGPVLAAVRRLGVPVPPRAFDFLTVAMAVTAADTFVRKEDADDGWSRSLELRVPVSEPRPWAKVVPSLERALNFLSGDQWHLEIVSNGPDRPPPQTRGVLTALDGHDCVCLFSGGLDSAIGALDLVRNRRHPLLVSHAYRGDAARQQLVGQHLPASLSRFSANANPRSQLELPTDVQMRTRSFNFLAYGALVGAVLVEQGIVEEAVDLYVPENGLIALNPPLTPRRIGALSTRTTHPYFLELVASILEKLGIPVHIHNPYASSTKGEMLAQPANMKKLLPVAAHTVSCGKWKRTGVQCGRCVPCIIRRASFHAAGIDDKTDYSDGGADLSTVMAMEDMRDDLLAMLLAVRRLPDADVAQWVSQAGPLPHDRGARDALVSVARRGLIEVRTYLDHLGLVR